LPNDDPIKNVIAATTKAVDFDVGPFVVSGRQ